MGKAKRSVVDKSMAAGLIVWLILGTGLAAAGTLTLTLEPSLDSKGDIIKATSITKAQLFGYYNYNSSVYYETATITNGTALFNLSDRDAGDRFILINSLNDPYSTAFENLNTIPTRIDDPTKNIYQFVGHTLRVSVIGNLSDPTYITEFSGRAALCFGGPAQPDWSDISTPPGNSYIILSLKTNPQKLEVNSTQTDISLNGIKRLYVERITDYTPTSPIHPNTSTAINPPFSKWVFSHGVDYNGNDSKCSTCHGNLDTRQAGLLVSDITVNNSFCFRCHNGKSGSDIWIAGGNCYHPTGAPPGISTSPTSTATPTAIPPTPKTPGFEALSAIAALLVAILIRR